MRNNLPKDLGILLLAVWLILEGIIPILNLSFSGLPTLMAILAIATGIVLIIQR